MEVAFFIESEEIFKNVAQEIVNNLYGSNVVSVGIETNILKQAKDDLKNIFSSCNFDINKVKEVLLGKGWNEDKLKYFFSLLDSRNNELLYEILLYHNSAFGDTVVNFDWYLKIVLGTSELKMLKYPLLQLVLLTNSTNERKQRVYDVNKNILNKLINILEELDEIKR
ncbi:uncharacterized protein LOC113517700 isoform X2 [Galleria mellonella]|nr:uncharacterized protein LOC113517700 isoform X2 [Galleria mellonella]XP_052756022.1 uncharacterized protein LOC113517700 isoform X2 [Galleria mellonella]XP_052756023.1 uncharacterized protein LOC113517700 isoform X2 [Galleria mellonella]